MNHHEADKLENWAPSLAEILAKAPAQNPLERKGVHVEAPPSPPEGSSPTRNGTRLERLLRFFRS